MEPMCGRRSESSIPHWPYFLKVRGVPMIRADSFARKAKRMFFNIDSGSACPSSWFRIGFGS
jgi:hypothetical protein